MFRAMLVVALVLCGFSCVGCHSAKQGSVEMTVTSVREYRQPIEGGYDYLYLMTGETASGLHVICKVNGIDGRHIGPGDTVTFENDRLYDESTYVSHVNGYSASYLVYVLFIGEDMNPGPGVGR